MRRLMQTIPGKAIQRLSRYGWLAVVGCLLMLAIAVPLRQSLADPGAALGIPLSQENIQVPHSSGPSAIAGVASGNHFLFLPISRRDLTTLHINTQIKAESQWAYQTYYLPFRDAEIGWTGNHATCDAGTTNAAYRQALQDLVNYFRAMAGVPATITFDDTMNAKAQQAALMMSVNRRLSHSPDPGWICYTPAGAEAAGHSNLSYWYGYGSDYHGILGQMRDDGGGNYAAGHRRWILYPQTRQMGTGDVPEYGGYYAANALWVIEEATIWGPRPPTREAFVAWPPPGYVPRQVIYSRWSFSYDDADFSAAQITMSYAGSSIGLAVEPIKNGYGENTVVWIPDINWSQVNLGSNQAIQIELHGVRIGGSLKDFAYQVIPFDAGN